MNYKEFDEEFNDKEFKLFLKERVAERQMESMTSHFLHLLALAFNVGRQSERNQIEEQSNDS